MLSVPAGAFSSSPVLPVSMGVLLPYVAAALTVLITLLSRSRLTARFGDAGGIGLYFSFFFILLVAMPVFVIFLMENRPWQVLAELGLGIGNARRGLIMMGIALPVTLLISFSVSKSPEMKRQYPFSRSACSSGRSFILYETAYLLLYYTAWEFLYRGLLFFPLLAGLGFVAAASITAALSTVFHIGHPDSEIAGALMGGFIFAAVALLTGSILYSIAIHAMLGISNDAFIYFRYHRRRPAA